MPNRAAITVAVRMPICARLLSTGSSKASSATKSEMVNPIPASMLTPRMWDIRIRGPSASGRRRTTAHVAPVIPTTLPITSPAMIPQVSTDVKASASDSGVSRTPAFASAKTGRISHVTYGVSARCARSLTDTAWARDSSALRALRASGEIWNTRIRS